MMKIISQTTEFQIEEHTAIAIGKFDGIHRGHRRLLQEIFRAGSCGLKTAVFTFDPSPAVFLKGTETKELMTKEEKRALFARMGVDYLVEYPFNKETAAVMPENYVNQFLFQKMNASFIAAGEDISFGYQGAGDAELLRRMAQQRGVQVSIIPKLSYNGREISSTYVREAVLAGDMELAQILLEQPFSIHGVVERGNQIGRTIGMPTVNLHPGNRKIMPPNGVYFTTVCHERQTYYGVTNVGYKPTVEDRRRLGVETFLFDFDKDIYEQEISVFFHHFKRPEVKFDSLNALQAAISQDVEDAKAFFQL